MTQESTTMLLNNSDKLIRFHCITFSLTFIILRMLYVCQVLLSPNHNMSAPVCAVDGDVPIEEALQCFGGGVASGAVVEFVDEDGVSSASEHQE